MRNDLTSTLILRDYVALWWLESHITMVYLLCNRIQGLIHEFVKMNDRVRECVIAQAYKIK